MDQPTRGWKSDEDRGLIGAWFVRAIGDRSIEQVAKDMAERGHAHNPDYYRGIMSGSKKPGRPLLKALTEYLGSAPQTAASAGGDQSGLIATLERFTTVITDALERVVPPKPVSLAATVIPSRDKKTRRVQWLGIAMARRGWTSNVQAAREIGRDATTVGRWLNGTTVPRGAELTNLASKLDIPEALITDPPATDAERLARWHFDTAEDQLRQAM